MGVRVCVCGGNIRNLTGSIRPVTQDSALVRTPEGEMWHGGFMYFYHVITHNFQSYHVLMGEELSLCVMSMKLGYFVPIPEPLI